MTFFGRTFLFFISVIVLQAALTIPLVTNVTRRANLADARRELGEEAAVLYDGLNAWKRQLWKSLIDIANDRAVARQAPDEQDRSLRGLLLVTKADALAVKGARGAISDFVQASPGNLVISDAQKLANTRTHPYIALQRIGGVLYLVGVTTLSSPGGPSFDVFLLKRVDDDFCAQLTRNRKSSAVILEGSTLLASTLPRGTVPGFFDPSRMDSAYRELYGRRMGRGRFNAAFQKIGRLEDARDREELFLGTFLSNDPYDEKLIVLDRTILFVSLAGALFALALSIFLSRNITHPVEELLAAMGRIRDGALDTRVRSRGGPEIGRLLASFNDMARELAQNRAAIHGALQESMLLKEYNEQIVNSIGAGIAIVNRDLVVERANSAFLRSFAREGAPVIGAPLTYLNIDIIDESMVEKIFAIFRRECTFHSEVKRAENGRVFEIRLSPFYSTEGELREASGCVFMAEDVSAKTELEQKIFQAEKLATISMLSAGMAHEINNPLGSILTNVQNLIDEEESDERRVSLKWIEAETRRIGRIVQELLNFAASDAGHAAGSDVNQVVREVIALVSRSLGREERIRIDTRLAADLPHVVVSTDELKQVVINLLKNSVQAIDGPGRIVLVTRRAIGWDRVSLSIADTGSGIPKEIMPRIFDPFFTTKANGEGTGLGLSVVYGIVTKYNGTIDVRSREGRGARFSLALPCMGGGAARSGGGRT